MRLQITHDELDSLYRSIGECIWHLQYVEDVLHTLITLKVEIKKPGAVPEAKAFELLAKHRRATLGTALGTAEKHAVLPADLMARVRLFKEERDWLVHRSMHQDGDDLYTSEGRSAIFKRLESFMVEAISLRHTLMGEMASFCEGHGLSLAQADALAKLQIASLKGDA